MTASAHAQDATTIYGDNPTDKISQIESSINYGLHPQIINVSGRETTSLNGEWDVIVDPFENGWYNYRRAPKAESKTLFADDSFYNDRTRLVEYDFDTDAKLQVPGDWNTQSERLYYYEGTVWYRRHFNVRQIVPNRRYFLYFGAVNYEAVVAVNGTVVGKHSGGFTPFNFEVTELLRKGQNTVVVKVDNKRRADAVPALNSDWWNYGGITRDVMLVETPYTFIRDYSLKVSKTKWNLIEGHITIDGPKVGRTVIMSIPELGVIKKIYVKDNGTADFTLKTWHERWSPESPKLYDVTFSYGDERLSDRIGFRTIEVFGKNLIINGKYLFLRGTCLHEEKMGGGRACTEEDYRQQLELAREMNCNFLRLAHYPHGEQLVRMADESGMLLWEEIPVYWTIDWNSARAYDNADNQLCDLIKRDANRASVIIWSLFNETPKSMERDAFLGKLIDKARRLDDSRLISAALEKSYTAPGVATVEDPLLRKMDVVGFNEYVGWYDGKAEKCQDVVFSFDFEKPVLVTEFGAGAKAGRHGSPDELFTEECQENVFRENIKMQERIPGFVGSCPWILTDFRSPRRLLKGIHDDYNRKGLVSEQGERKKAFHVMQEWYARKAAEAAAAED